MEKGDRLGDWLVLDVVGRSARLRCKCGYERVSNICYLEASKPQSCFSCSLARRALRSRAGQVKIDWSIGAKVGGYTILTEPRKTDTYYVVDVRCMCGALRTKSVSYLRNHPSPRCAACASAIRFGNPLRVAADDVGHKERVCECGRVILNGKDWCAWCEKNHV